MAEPKRSEVAAGFVVQLVVFGAVYTFGVVLDAVRADLRLTRGNAALLPAVAAACLFFVGPFTGRAADRWGTRLMVRVGGALLAAGLLVTSVAPSLPVALLGFGLAAGIAAGCVYVPVVASIAARSGPRSALRIGVVVAGVGLGTALVSPLLRAMSDNVGWRDAYRLYAVVALLVLGAASFAFPSGPPVLDRRAEPGASAEPGGSAPAMSFGATLRGLAASAPFRRLYVALLLVSPSVYLGLVFLASYATGRSIGSGRSAALLSIFGLTSTGGRVLLAALGRRVPARVVFTQCFVALGASLVIWALAGASYPLLVLYAVVAGTGYGGLIGLAPTITAVALGTSNLATTLGLLYTSLAFGGLLTGPLAGAAIDRAGYRPTLVALVAVTVLATVALPRPSAAAPPA